MNMLALAWRNTVKHPLNLLMTIILFGLGVGLISFLLLFNEQLKDKFDKNLAEIDLVVGAKGSPLQLILCSMYHIDNPTGNMSIEKAAPLLRDNHPLIKKAVPLSLGDNYKSYRIVGTNHDILGLYNGTIAKGTAWKKDFEVTIGSAVAETTGLKQGDTFVSSHGFAEDDELAHDHASFKVVGIIEETGTVLDQLILTNTASIWKVHDHQETHEDAGESAENTSSQPADTTGHDHGEHEGHNHDDHAEHNHDHDHEHEGHNHDDHAEHNHDHDHEGHSHDDHDHDSHDGHAHDNSNADLLYHADKEITSILIQYKNRTNFQALNFGRNINENTDMQAASPAIEINRLYSMIGVGTDALRSLALLIAFVSALSIFISLFKSMRERKYELALIRVMGAGRKKIFSMIMLEGLMLAVIGFIFGTIISHAGMEIMSSYLKQDFRYNFTGMMFLPQEWFVLGISLALGLVAAFIPAWQASGTDIHRTLSDK
jgi:putative ABC transport system permease protein